MHERPPLVSVIVPAYRHQDYIAHTLQSIIDQTYADIELIVIDDGSPDATAGVVRRYEPLCRERFVRFEFRSRKNAGLCATLNEGLAWAQGEYVCILASDDAWLPEKTARQVSYLDAHAQVAGVFANVFRIDEQGSRLARQESFAAASYDFDRVFLRQCHLPAPAAMLRRAALDATGGYDPAYRIEDWYMWLRLTQAGGCLDLMADVLAEYRIHGANTSGNALFMLEEERKIIDLYPAVGNYRRVCDEWSLQAFLVYSRLAKRRALSLLPVVLRFPRDRRVWRGLFKLPLVW